LLSLTVGAIPLAVLETSKLVRRAWRRRGEARATRT